MQPCSLWDQQIAGNSNTLEAIETKSARWFFQDYTSTSTSRAYKQMITSHLWSAVLKMWLDLNYHDPSVPVPTLLWNNSHIKYQGNVLMFTDWKIGKILYVKDIKGPSGFITFQDIRNKIGNSQPNS